MTTISQALLDELNEDLTLADINNLINVLNSFKAYMASRPSGQINKLRQWTTSYNHILDLIEAHLHLLNEPFTKLPSDIDVLLEVLNGERNISSEELLDNFNQTRRGRYLGPMTTRELIMFSQEAVKEKQ